LAAAYIRYESIDYGLAAFSLLSIAVAAAAAAAAVAAVPAALDLQQDLPSPAAVLEQPAADFVQPALAAGAASVLTAVAVAVLDLQQPAPLAADFVQAAFSLLVAVAVAVLDLQQVLPSAAAVFEQEAALVQPALGSPLTSVAVALLSAAALAACGHCAEAVPSATKANITNIIRKLFIGSVWWFD